MRAGAELEQLADCLGQREPRIGGAQEGRHQAVCSGTSHGEHVPFFIVLPQQTFIWFKRMTHDKRKTMNGVPSPTPFK